MTNPVITSVLVFDHLQDLLKLISLTQVNDLSRKLENAHRIFCRFVGFTGFSPVGDQFQPAGWVGLRFLTGRLGWVENFQPVPALPQSISIRVK